MVGDSHANDIVSGSRAGSATALLDSGRRYVESQSGKEVLGIVPDLVIHSLSELPGAMESAYDLGF